MKPSTSLGTRSNVGIAKPSPAVRQTGNMRCLLVMGGVYRSSVLSGGTQVKYRCRCRGMQSLTKTGAVPVLREQTKRKLTACTALLLTAGGECSHTQRAVFMRKVTAWIVLVALFPMVLGGCATGTQTGAVLGATAGAVIGAGVGFFLGGQHGAVIGATIGTALGT